MQYSGLFSVPPENIMKVLHYWPLLTGAVVSVLVGLSGFMVAKSRDCTKSSSPLNATWARVGYLGMLLFGCGVIVSSLTRFEGSITLSEGQGIALEDGKYDAGTLYQRKFSGLPTGSLTVKDIAHFLSQGKKPLWRHSADAFYRKDQVSGQQEMRLDSLIPAVADGFFYRIETVGYSPHFLLFDSKGSVVEDIYAVMQLYPPGAEDSFRFDMVPHTFYLRYYPDASLAKDKSVEPGTKPGPLYKVRIARNIELISDVYAVQEDTIPVDGLFLSLPDVKRWVEIRIVRDLGIYIMIPGLMFMGVSLGLLIFKRKYQELGARSEVV